MMYSIKEINEVVRDLKVEAIEEDGTCWCYTDDPDASSLFGWNGEGFNDVSCWHKFEIKPSLHNADKVWVVFH